MKAIVYRVELLEPVLVSDIEGDPNSAVAFDYLPGGVLRGAFIARHLQDNATADPAGDPTTRRLFFNGQTRYLNGYCLDRLDRRSLPTPRSWQQQKDDEQQLRDGAREEPPGELQWNPVKKTFRVFSTAERGKTEFVEPERRIAVHTARTRRFGRAMSEKDDVLDHSEGDQQGAVYRYDALAAGQTFEAVILCEDADEAALEQFIQGEIRLGKSRSGGYGRAQIHLVDQTTQAGPWREYESDQAPWLDNSQAAAAWEEDEQGEITWDEEYQDEVRQEEQNQDESLPCAEPADEAAPNAEEQADLWPVPGGQLVVTLLSDALLRDDLGQYVVDAEVVKTLLERELDCQLDYQRVFLAERISGGFNRKWGLPLPQHPAVAMGSVFVYGVAALKRATVNRLLERGIGERRAEGFGRLAINWQTEDELTVDKTKANPPPALLQPLSGAAATAAQLMVNRLLRQQLDRKVTELANRVGLGRGKPGVMDHPPRNSQIARLRAIVHEALRAAPADLAKAEDYLGDLNQIPQALSTLPPRLRKVGYYLAGISERAAARRQFERARIAQHNLRSWLEAVLQQSSEANWKKMFAINEADLRGLGGIKPQLSEELRYEYLLRFIDAVLARAAKQAREEG